MEFNEIPLSPSAPISQCLCSPNISVKLLPDATVIFDEICGRERVWNCHQATFLRGILGRLTVGPTIQDRIQPLHIQNGRDLGVLSKALHLLRNSISLPRQSWVPVSGLSSEPLLI